MSKHEEQNQKWSVSKLPLSASTPQYHTARPAKSEYSTQTQLHNSVTTPTHATCACYLRMLLASHTVAACRQSHVVAHSHHT